MGDLVVLENTAKGEILDVVYLDGELADAPRTAKDYDPFVLLRGLASLFGQLELCAGQKA